MADTITRPQTQPQDTTPAAVDIENIVGFGSGGIAPPADSISQMCNRKGLALSKERITQFLSTNDIEEQSLVSRDIRAKMKNGWRARDQYARGTCTAFAAVAAVELLLGNNTGDKERLSPEFVYWNMRYNPQYMLDRDVDLVGTKLKQASGVVTELGLAQEIDFPYPRHDPQIPVGPSDIVLAKAAINRVQQSEYWDLVEHGCPLVPTTLTIYKELAKGRPVCVGVPVFRFGKNVKDNWNNRASVDTGIVYGPEDKTNEDKEYAQASAHVVTIVGFQPDKPKHGGGWFIFKNSWGPQFGKYPHLYANTPPNPFGIGFGAISAHYLEARCWELLSLKLL